MRNVDQVVWGAPPANSAKSVSMSGSLAERAATKFTASMTSDGVLAPMIAQRSTLSETPSSSRDVGFRPPSIVYVVAVAHGIVEKTIGMIPVDRH